MQCPNKKKSREEESAISKEDTLDKHTHTPHSKMRAGRVRTRCGIVVDVAGELHLSNARGSGESVSCGEE